MAAEFVPAVHDAVHVCAYDLRAASHEKILNRAVAEARVVVSADTDSGTLLTDGRDLRPSIILFRRGTERRPQVLFARLPRRICPRHHGWSRAPYGVGPDAHLRPLPDTLSAERSADRPC